MDELHDSSVEWRAKTVPHMASLLEQMASLPSNKKRKDFCRDESFHAVKCGLVGMVGVDTAAGNLFSCFGLDSMHVEDLGVFLYIVDAIKVSLA